jgi:hypothetical protein
VFRFAPELEKEFPWQTTAVEDQQNTRLDFPAEGEIRGLQVDIGISDLSAFTADDTACSSPARRRNSSLPPPPAWARRPS